jgi:putative salt-induced outer membrane protein YdiY
MLRPLHCSLTLANAWLYLAPLLLCLGGKLPHSQAQGYGYGELPSPSAGEFPTTGNYSGGYSVPSLNPPATNVDIDAILADLPQNSEVVGSSISGDALDPLPLKEQRVSWYRQYPWLIIPLDGWSNSVEFGLNGSSGNSETTSVQLGADLQRITETYRFTVDIDYQKTQASGSETQNNGRMNVSFDRLIGNSNWTTFTKMGLEYDEFKSFDLRVNMNAGLGYYWIKNEATSVITRFGAGASREIGGVDDDWAPEAVFGYEIAHQLTARQKIKGQMEYFPQWDDFNSYRIVSDVSWEILLDGIDNLSLKLAATDRYDSTPHGLDPNDLFYSALLIWKF